MNHALPAPHLKVTHAPLGAAGRGPNHAGPCHAQAQSPMAEASVEALVQALDSGPRTRSFMRTQLPNAGTNLCQAACLAA